MAVLHDAALAVAQGAQLRLGLFENLGVLLVFWHNSRLLVVPGDTRYHGTGNTRKWSRADLLGRCICDGVLSSQVSGSRVWMWGSLSPTDKRYKLMACA